MGIGIVLLGWLIFCGCISIPFVIGLAAWSWYWSSRSGWRSIFRALAAGLLPLVIIQVGLIWFFAYATYSEVVRGVDPGLGDSWATPIGFDYYFCMIDTNEDGYLMKDGCTGSPTIGGIHALTRVGERIVGSRGADSFVINLVSGNITHYSTLDEALGQFSPQPKLQTPNDFYSQYRLDWRDTAALISLVLIELLVIAIWYRLFIHRQTRNEMGAVPNTELTHLEGKEP